MRYIVILLFLIQLSTSAQQHQTKGQNVRKKQLPSLSADKELLSLIEDSSFIYNDAKKFKVLDKISRIDYYNIRKYPESIRKLSSYNKQIERTDNEFYISILRLDAFTSYRSGSYIEAQSKLKNYLLLYKDYYKNDTSFAFEFSKYSYCFLKTNQQELFFSYIDSALYIAHKKQNPNHDLSITYFTSSIYYMNLRQADTSRTLLNKAINHWELSNKLDFRLKYYLHQKLAYAELYDGNLQLSQQNFEIAEENLLKIDHTETELASLLLDKSTPLLLSNKLIQCIKQLKMALHIFESEKPLRQRDISTAHEYLGLCYKNLGEIHQAETHFMKSIKANSNSSNLSFRNLANVYFFTKENKKADSLFQISIDYFKNIKEPTDYQRAMTNFMYGQFLIENDFNKVEGEKHLKKAISEWFDHFNGPHENMSTPLNILGTHYLLTGNIEEGLDSLQSSIRYTSEKFNNKDIYSNPLISEIPTNNDFNNALAWKAYGFYLLYLKTDDISDLEMSFNTYKFYIHCANELRKNYDQVESVNTSSEIHYVYNQAIDVGYILYSKTNDENVISEIFNFIEGKKSFTLYQSLNILEKKKLLKVPKSLIKKELYLKTQLGRIEEEIKVELSSSNQLENIENLDKEAFHISETLDSIQKEYKEKYSSFYNLKYGFKELSIEEIQERIPKSKAFINYSLSDSLLNIFTVTKDHFSLHTDKIDSSFFQDIKNVVRLLKRVDTDNSYREFISFTKSSSNLYKKLIQPLESQIQGKDLIFIPDGVLSYISFDALLTEEMTTERPDYRALPYLIKKYKSNVANSMQIYFNMKSREIKPNDKVYAFAPIYQNNKKTDSIPQEYEFLRPLDYAKMEVKSIERNLKTKTFMDGEASEENFFNEAKDAGVLHLAMHTFINDEDPLYSKLLFTYNQKSSSGLVNTYELLGLDLNAELAVLSGCSTGEGELQQGEGVMSLSSGFQFAGVPAIIMSLWEVNDRFGALVIDKFYQYLALGDKKSQALYKAKVEVLAQGNALYAHPYYWAGLTLMGDDAKLQFVQRKKWDAIILGGTILLALGIFIFQRRKKWAA